MMKFRSLSQRLSFGYISGTVILGALLTLFDVTELGMMAQFALSILAIVAVFLVIHLFFYRHFLRPVHHLIQITRELANSNNSQVRAQKLFDDELGDLVDALNEMINQIQLREEIIISERDRVAIALEQADDYARVTQSTNKKLEFEVKVRKRIEAKLTDFQKFLNSIINSMPSGLIAVDENLTVTQWNQEASNISGTPDSNAIGRPVQDVFPLFGGHKDWIADVWRDNKNRTLRNQLSPYSGRRFDIVVYPLKNTETPSAVIRIDDVSEKYKMEEAMVQSEKVKSLGGMAAGMAHEINNPISAIIQNVQNIQRRLDPELSANIEVAQRHQVDLHQMQAYMKDRRILSFLNHISESGVRSSQLVTNMLQFSRASDLRLQPCLMVDVLEKAVNIAVTDDQLYGVKGAFELNIDQDFKAPEATVMGVFNELEQVFLNLIKNAAQAINERRLTLNDIDEGIITLQLTQSDRHCLVRVSDNGIGMEANTRKKIFEPFFTTKEVGAGTGLGLSVSYFIVRSHHNGQMTVESSFGSGTVFEISIPLAEG
ncbi:sensor histidine kinase [Reinekea blandensis]|uniref:histidine kinase n=1 Tax=Reinekea blandensis MED297 TaxID=314283 RepID=A4BER1_9GAMM|nr:ATP-binding protein [Reinekea blandensis]EAR09488.1 Multi-sensor Signal Transduction Histidine Kinase [Reinekea sp. MED297] [Reinekea blandensis MED297]